MASPQTYYPKKFCRFCADHVDYIDYKDMKVIGKYLSSYGKIESRKRAGTCQKHQRALATALKRARIMGLAAFTNK
jgi:small subunit ribosomal protein S18